MVRSTTHLFMGVALALMAPTVASAADLPLDPPVFEEVIVEETPQQFDWTGFYAGAFVGYGWSDDSFETTGNAAFLALAPGFFPNSLDPQSNGFLGGLTGGYNHRVNRFVLGVEGDIALSDINGSDDYTGANVVVGAARLSFNTRAEQNIEYFGTLRGRLGFLATERLMVFGTGGLAFGQVKTESTVTHLPAGAAVWSGSDDSFKLGWTVGGGAEFLATERISIKLDGLYYDLENSNTTATPNAAALALPGVGGVNYENEIDNTGIIGRLGVNYHF